MPIEISHNPKVPGFRFEHCHQPFVTLLETNRLTVNSIFMLAASLLLLKVTNLRILTADIMFSLQPME